MIYNENGHNIEIDNSLSILYDINEITNSMVNLMSLCEKTTEARQVKGYESSMSDYSVMSSDLFSSQQKQNMGKDDTEKIKKLLQESNDICKEYEEWASADFDKVYEKAQTIINKPGNVTLSLTGQPVPVESEGMSGVEYAVFQLFNQLVSAGYNAADVKKYIVTQYYDISDDPEHIKKLLHLRLNYNKKMISIYKKMLSLNYNVLNLTKQQAENMSSNINIDEIKEVISKNKDKFIKRDGKFYDLRELGFGVGFIQNEISGLEAFSTFEHFLPYLMRYDVVFLTHGHYNSKNLLNYLSKKFRNESKKINEIRNRIINLDSEVKTIEIDLICNDDKDDVERLKKLKEEKNKEIEDLTNELGKMYGSETMARFSFGARGKYSKWVCAPINTESGGPFTDINKLIQQCIKEARSNKEKYNLIKSNNKNIHIMVLSCNPGAIQLDKSITSQKDVHIHYAKSFVIAENTNRSVYDDIYLCEQNLKQFCNDIGIDYNNDRYLNECFNNITDSDIDTLQEMSIKELWTSAVNLAKKIWAAIVAAFKAVINFFKDIFQKIKMAIKNKDADVQDVSYITMESAKVRHSKDVTLGKAEYEIEKACSSIAKSINRLEQQQTNIMRKINNDLMQKSRTV